MGLSKIRFSLPTTLILCLYLPTIYWIITRWLSNSNSLIHVLTFISLLGIIAKRRILRTLKFKKYTSPLTFYVLASIAAFHLINFFIFQIAIISALLFLISLIVLFKNTFTTKYHMRFQIGMAVLLFLSLPIQPLLGATIGLITRYLYTQIIWSLANIFGFPTEQTGLSLINADNILHIDASCSGVWGSMIITIVVLLHLLYYQSPSTKIIRVLVRSISLYLILNGIRLLLVFIAHNVYQIHPVDFLDLVLSSLALSICLLFALFQLRKYT